MKIVRYCGKERLPGGERLWRRLAKEAGYDGTLKVYGYGTAGNKSAVLSQRAYETGGKPGEWDWPVIGLHSWNTKTNKTTLIEVWLPCQCATALDEYKTIRYNDMLEWLPDRYEPLHVFAHELGHAMQQLDGIDQDKSEPGATKRGNNLLERVIGK
jgi:hypothetical protein